MELTLTFYFLAMYITKTTHFKSSSNTKEGSGAAMA